MTPETLCGLLAEPDRLATFAAVVLGCATASEVANRTGLGGREVAAALRRYLVDEGLMSREHGVYWRTGGHVEVGG